MKPTDACDITILQRYVNNNAALHTAIGEPESTPLTLSPFAQGEYNVNYLFERPSDGKRFLLRVNLGSQMHLKQQITYEMNALGALRESGRAPRAYYVDDTKQRIPAGIGVEEWLPGRPLRYETDLAVAARILADIHATPTDKARTCLIAPPHPLSAIVAECEQMFCTYRAWSNADEHVVQKVDRMFETARECACIEVERECERGDNFPRCIVNTEVNSGNFLINDDGTSYLIDWEKPLLSDPAQDLGHFLVPTTTYWKTDTWLDDAAISRFLDEYLLAVGGRFDTRGLRERLNDYLTVTCLRGITWCAMAYTEYAEDDRALSNADTFEKIQEYVSIPFIDRICKQFYDTRS
ncbi:phosphotransferase family protein [Adlercreutzia sp. ZJ138]|uniref:phosphotransferase family protein n=1 Tax=Adlercreutzia sp. ZJ138 TaxID=2709405 RepID=UPI0013EC35E5|nr:aminoglycoside phosphotransferase family protein [Adlercreutzia sp. ZJ138]